MSSSASVLTVICEAMRADAKGIWAPENSSNYSHVDHGKSTLMGNSCMRQGDLPDGKLAELEADSIRLGLRPPTAGRTYVVLANGSSVR